MATAVAFKLINGEYGPVVSRSAQSRPTDEGIIMPRFLNRERANGFTIFELAMVIVIIGSVASIILPKFIDLSDQAAFAARDNVAAAIASGSLSNFTAKLLKKPGAVAINQANTCNNAVLGSLFPTGKLPENHFVDPTVSPKDNNCSNGATAVMCFVLGVKLDGTPTPPKSMWVYCAA